MCLFTFFLMFSNKLGQMEKLIEATRRRDTIEVLEKSVIGKKIDLDEA